MAIDFPVDEQSISSLENASFKELHVGKIKGGFPVLSATPTYTGKQGETVLVDNKTSTGKVKQICNFLNGTWICSEVLTKSVVRVGLSTAQTITAGNTTRVAFDREDYDTNSEFNTTTNRFTAKSAGYYQVHCNAYFNTEENTFQLFLYKNDAVFLGSLNNGYGYSWFLTDIVYMNGTTDYLEIYCNALGGNKVLSGGGDNNTSTTLTIHKI